MFFKQFKKLLSFKKSDQVSLGKAGKTLDFAIRSFKNAVSESHVIVEKLKHLQKTNYELGIDHLKRGNLREAIFRFKIVRKFWPEDYNAHLKLIYCYFVIKDDDYANRAIEYLLYLDSSYQPQIEQLRQDASFYDDTNLEDNQK